jgi:hypothetical protein
VTALRILHAACPRLRTGVSQHPLERINGAAEVVSALAAVERVTVLPTNSSFLGDVLVDPRRLSCGRIVAAAALSRGAHLTLCVLTALPLQFPAARISSPQFQSVNCFRVLR